jgi:membrane protein DedA with SNARE-associated domain
MDSINRGFGVLGFWGFGVLGVFFGALAEEFFYIIPSSIVQLSAGAILLGKISFSWVLVGKAMLIIGIPAAVGVTIGSLPYYALGYFGGKPAIEKWGKWLGINWQQVEELDAKLLKNWWDELIFIGLRALPILPSVLLSVGPGVLRLPMRTYLIGSFIGTFIRATIMGFVGGLLGGQFDTIKQTVDSAEKIGLVFFIISCIIGVWLYLKSKNKKSNNELTN